MNLSAVSRTNKKNIVSPILEQAKDTIAEPHSTAIYLLVLEVCEWDYSTYASTYQAQEEEGEVTAEQKSVVFTVRWCSETRGLTSTGYRIRFREQLYNIESVDPMNYQKKILKIHCRLERRQPDEQNRQH